MVAATQVTNRMGLAPIAREPRGSHKGEGTVPYNERRAVRSVAGQGGGECGDPGGGGGS